MQLRECAGRTAAYVRRWCSLLAASRPMPLACLLRLCSPLPTLTAPRRASAMRMLRTSSRMGPRRAARHFVATPLWCPPRRAEGAPVPGAAVRDGVALQHARRRKERRYPELRAAGPHRLGVLPCEVGGRRAQRAPPALRASESAGWRRRWWGILAVAQQTVLTSGLLGAWATPAMPAADTGPPLAERCVARRPQPPAPGAAYSHPPVGVRRQKKQEQKNNVSQQ